MKKKRKSAWNRWICQTVEGVVFAVAGLAFIGWCWAGVWFCYLAVSR